MYELVLKQDVSLKRTVAESIGTCFFFFFFFFVFFLPVKYLFIALIDK